MNMATKMAFNILCNLMIKNRELVQTDILAASRAISNEVLERWKVDISDSCLKNITEIKNSALWQDYINRTSKK